MENRQRDILVNLYKIDGYMTAKNLALDLGVSSKTIRNDIKAINSLIWGSGEIKSEHAKGFYLVVDDDEEFNKVFSELYGMQRLSKIKLDTPEGRIIQILDILLNRSGYIKIEDIAEEIIVSNILISKDLQTVKEEISKYNLKLVSKPYYGVKIRGDEKDKRRCYSNILGIGNYSYFTIKSLSKDNEIKFIEIKSILEKNFKKFNFKTTHAMFKNIMIHIFIMLDRISTGNTIILTNSINPLVKENGVIKIANELCDDLEDLEQIIIPKDERIYTAYHLVCKNCNYDYKYNTISEDTDNLLNKIFMEINKVLNIDFSNDLDLKLSLGLHIEPLIERILLGISLKNPIVEDIKKDIIAYQVATIGSTVINRTYNTTLDDNEIAYLASHFSLALLRKNTDLVQKNILVVCGTGRGTAQLMKYKLEKEFSKYIRSIKCIDYLQIREIKYEYDLIVTTIDLESNLDITTPILKVSPILTHMDLDHIRPLISEKDKKNSLDILSSKNFYSNYVANSRCDFLYKISEDISKRNDVYENFYEELCRREKLAPTSFDNLIAIPHPLTPSSKETFISIIVLEKPIKWDKKNVQFIMLLSIGKNDTRNMQEIYQSISRLLLSREKINNIIKKPTYENFLVNFLEGEDYD